MSTRFRWLRRVSIGVLVCLVLLSLAVAWLVGTRSGARFVVAQVERAMPELEVGSVEGRLLGGLTLRDLALRQAGAEIELEQVFVRIGASILWNYRRLVVHELALDGLIVSLPAASADPQPASPPGTVTLPALPEIRLPIAVSLRQLTVRGLGVVQAGATLIELETLRASGEASGALLDDLVLELERQDVRLGLGGSLQMGGELRHDLRLAWQTGAASGELLLAGTRARIAVQHRLTTPVSVQTAGEVRLPIDADLEVALESTSEAGHVDAANGRVAWSDARLSLDGGPSAWQSELALRLLVPQGPALGVQALARGDLQSADVLRIEVRPDTGGRVAVDGDIDWQAATARLETQLHSLALDGWLSTLSGSLTGTANARLSWANDVAARVRVDELAGVVNGYELSLAGAAGVQREQVDIDQVTLRLGPNTLAANGVVARNGPAELELRMDAPALDALGVGVAGDLSVDGQIEGPWPSLRARATVRSSALEWQGAPVASGLDFMLEGSAAQHRLQLVATDSAAGPLELSFSGVMDGQQWRGTLETFSAQPDLAAASPIAVALAAPASLNASRDTIEWSDLCLRLGQDGRVCSAGGWRSGELLATTVQIDRIDLMPWLARYVPLTVSGALTGELSLAGPPQQLDGEAQLGIDGFAVGPGNEPASTLVARTFDMTWQWRSGSLDAQLSVDLGDDGLLAGALGVDRWLARDATLTGAMTLEMPDLTALNGWQEFVQIDAGRLRAGAEVSGAADSPAFGVEVSLSDGTGVLRTVNVPFSDAALTVSGDPREDLEFAVRLLAGAGQLRARGEIDARSGAIDGHIDAEGATIAALPDIRLVATTDVSVHLGPAAQVVQGSVRVDEAEVVVRALPEGAVAVSPDTEIVSANDPLEPLELQKVQDIDLQLSLGPSVELSGFGLDTRLEGALRVRQRTNRAPEGFGELELRDAQYLAYGQRLAVSRGTLVFSGPLDSPQLAVRAEREIDDTRVGIDISGTPELLTSTLTSDPALDDAEVLSLLLTGRSLSSANSDEGGTLADAAITLGLKRAFGVSGAIRDTVGLDTLSVEGSGQDGRVLAGKQLSERLYLQYAYGVFDQVSRVLLRWQLSDRLALESSSGDTQTVDLVYSVGNPR